MCRDAGRLGAVAHSYSSFRSSRIYTCRLVIWRAVKDELHLHRPISSQVSNEKVEDCWTRTSVVAVRPLANDQNQLQWTHGGHVGNAVATPIFSCVRMPEKDCALTFSLVQ